MADKEGGAMTIVFAGPREYVPGHGEIRSPEDYPYSYSPYFISGSAKSAKAAQSAYSDRFTLWYTDEQIKAARETADMQSHGDYFWRQSGLAKLSRFLSELHGKPTKAVAIAEGCNVSNGYPYWIVWFKDAPQHKEADGK